MDAWDEPSEVLVNSLAPAGVHVGVREHVHDHLFLLIGPLLFGLWLEVALGLDEHLLLQPLVLLVELFLLKLLLSKKHELLYCLVLLRGEDSVEVDLFLLGGLASHANLLLNEVGLYVSTQHG